VTSQAPSLDSAATEYASRLPRWRILLTAGAVMVAVFMASLDSTIVATALPTVIGDLHGINHYAWVFTAYLLAQIATIPLWGRLADIYGRKRIFLLGMVLFLLGSVLCGMATSMIQLVLFRGLQGVGAGCVLPVAQTITADLFTMEQRAKAVAVMSSGFAIAVIIGPLIGGFLTDNLSWRWVFYVNIPVGIVAIALVAFAMIEPLQHRRRHRIDWLGTFTLLGWTGLLVFALETGGRDYAWGSPTIIGTLAGVAALLATFIVVERRAPEPIMPFSLFSVPTLRAAAVINVALGVALYAVISFLPLFVQVVLQSSATDAGRVLTPMMLALMGGTVIGAKLVLRFGFRAVCALTFATLLIGAGWLTRIGIHSTQLDTSAAMIVFGLGLGFGSMSVTLAAQNSVDLPRMGIATGLINFTRQLGGALGVAVVAAFMLNTLTDRITKLFPHAHIKAASLLSPQVMKRFPASSQLLVRHAFADALHVAFVVTFIAVMLGAFTTLLMPKGRATDIRDAARRSAATDEQTEDDRVMVLSSLEEPAPETA
jgi:EmrB/QacA subfamily drug resistance transporter